MKYRIQMKLRWPGQWLEVQKKGWVPGKGGGGGEGRKGKGERKSRKKRYMEKKKIDG